MKFNTIKIRYWASCRRVGMKRDISYDFSEKYYLIFGNQKRWEFKLEKIAKIWRPNAILEISKYRILQKFKNKNKGIPT